jgi:phosphoglycolate phosphatase-like HAD superfamily hydrolase
MTLDLLIIVDIVTEGSKGMNYPDIEKFSKQQDYLLCIDSDGTAMDAMNSKHKKCFGPCFVSEWGLDSNRHEVLNIWNEVNLYSKTRGFNRFLTLVEVLKRINGKCQDISELDTLANWVESAPELSNRCLKEEIEKKDSAVLKKALSWSLAVNMEIAKLTSEDNKPFEGVKDCLEYAFGKVDISVISSANMNAIFEEWGHFDMLKYIGAMTSQEIGTKEQCISKMLQKGYKAENVLMIGDAFPDIEAAKANGVFFYPILPDKEKECWTKLREFYLGELITGNYQNHQEKLIKKFYDNFEGEKNV